jgi:hypothetical protein
MALHRKLEGHSTVYQGFSVFIAEGYGKSAKDGLGSFWTARWTLAGDEAMAMIRKGQVRNIGGRDIKAQARFIATLFEVAVC